MRGDGERTSSHFDRDGVDMALYRHVGGCAGTRLLNHGKLKVLRNGVVDTDALGPGVKQRQPPDRRRDDSPRLLELERELVRETEPDMDQRATSRQLSRLCMYDWHGELLR